MIARQIVKSPNWWAAAAAAVVVYSLVVVYSSSRRLVGGDGEDWLQPIKRWRQTKILHENVDVLVCQQWTDYSDTNVPGGRYNSASTLATCKSNCIAYAECTGFDWVPYSNDKCWFHGPWSAGNSMNTYTGVDHYDLDRSCNGRLNQTYHGAWTPLQTLGIT